MPIIEVNMLEGRTVEQKQALVSAMTDAVVAALGVQPDQVRILIREMGHDHFAVGGVTRGAAQAARALSEQAAG